MFKNPEIPTDSGFTIWFNKKEKKEFYVTPLMNCNLTFNKKINNTYKERTGYTEIPVNRINRMDNDICIIKSITNRIRNYSDIK